MNIDKSKTNASVKGTDYENFLLDLTQKSAINTNVDFLFESLYKDFDLHFSLKKNDTDEDGGFVPPGFLEPQCLMFEMPSYNIYDLNTLDMYLHETGHMIDYYLVSRILKHDDIDNYSIQDAKLKDFIISIINYYNNNCLPHSIIDFFNNSSEYKTNPNKKYFYESLSDIITSITRGKYFNNSYHENMDITKWDNKKFLIYGHINNYFSNTQTNGPDITKIIMELFANYISICLLPNKDAYYLLKEIKNDKGENLQDVMNNFIADTVQKL